ncbi:MAG: Dickkopf N-terminal cysteine-rich domain-containing protein [Kofleriaceae bacterium]
MRRSPIQLFEKPAAGRGHALADRQPRAAGSSGPGRRQGLPDLIADGTCRLTSSNDNPLADCAATIGNVTDGQTCQADFECATPGARCVDPSGGQTCGPTRVCRAPAAIGQSCAGSAFCGTGDRCVRRINLSTCDTGAAGRPCDGNQDCDFGGFCNGGNNDGTASGICTAAKPVGAICRGDRECNDSRCVGATSSTTGFCRDVRQPGSPCDNPIGCWGNQYCAGPAGGPSTCVPALTEGAACGTANGQPWCGVTLACEGGACKTPGGVGATCTTSSDGIFTTSPDGCNAGLFCSNAVTMAASGTCEPPRADGGACTSGAHCASGYCANNQCAQFPVCGP